jgi:hypothetical protein
MKKSLIIAIGLCFSIVAITACDGNSVDEARQKAIADSLKADSLMQVTAAAEKARLDSLAAVAATTSGDPAVVDNGTGTSTAETKETTTDPKVTPVDPKITKESIKAQADSTGKAKIKTKVGDGKEIIRNFSMAAFGRPFSCAIWHILLFPYAATARPISPRRQQKSRTTSVIRLFF